MKEESRKERGAEGRGCAHCCKTQGQGEVAAQPCAPLPPQFAGKQGSGRGRARGLARAGCGTQGEASGGAAMRTTLKTACRGKGYMMGAGARSRAPAAKRKAKRVAAQQCGPL